MRKLLVLISIVGLLLAVSVPALAADVTFGWDANTESDLAGYKLYQSATSGDYSGAVPIDIPLSALAHPGDPEYTQTGVGDGTWYWVLTAYDTEGLESGYSNEVTKTIDTTPPAPPTNFWIKIVIAIWNWLRHIFA